MMLAPFYFNMKTSVLEFKTLRHSGIGKFILDLTSPNPEDLQTFALMISPNIPLTCEGSDSFTPWFREHVENFRHKFKEIGIDISEYSM